MNVSIDQATTEQSDQVAEMVKELLCEIMEGTGEANFRVNEVTLQFQARTLLAGESYVVLLASITETSALLGFVSMFEGSALYTEGVFGVVPELYVRAEFRSEGIGTMLVDHAVKYGSSQGWNRLEVTTPPLPEFERTLAFYEKHGFSVAGGKKLKRNITS